MRYTDDPLDMARSLGALILPDAKCRAHEPTIAQWRRRCLATGRRFILVQPIGVKRSVLRYEAPPGAPAVSQSWCDRLIAQWRHEGGPGLGATASPNHGMVRLDHVTAVDCAVELANGSDRDG